MSATTSTEGADSSTATATSSAATPGADDTDPENQQPITSRPSTPTVSFRARMIEAERVDVFTPLRGIVHVHATLNNTMLVLTEPAGSIRTWTSAGTVGFKGSRKTQPVAAERAAEELAKRALRLGYLDVDVRLKGPGSNKQYAVQALRTAGLNILTLSDVTPIPYNGCRPPKRRRV